MNLPVLTDTKPQGVVLSASQISRWDLCKRWWAWEYIAKIRTPPHPSAVLGTEVHGHLERWLRDAQPPPADTKSGQIATRMVKNLPPPGTGAVEKRFYMTSVNGHHYTGFIDWVGMLDALALIIDHKTSGNLRYAKTEAELHNDIQAVIYAVAAFAGFGTSELGLLWNYGETKKPFTSRAVKTLVHLPVVADKFERVIEPAAAEIVECRENAAHPLYFTPSPDSCGAFGGCPHRGRCNLTSQEMLGGLKGMTTPEQTMAERMAAEAQAGSNGAAQQPPPQQQPPPPPQAPPAAAQPPQAPPGPPQGAPQYPPQAPPPQAPPQGQPMAMLPPQPPQAPPGVQGAPQNTGYAPPGQPPMVAPPPQQAQQPQGAPQQQPPQQAYAPNVAPNPPESGQQPPPKEETAEAKGKAGPGRPKGARNKKLNIEQDIYMMGVKAAMANPAWDGKADMLIQAGSAAVEAFKAKFG